MASEHLSTEVKEAWGLTKEQFTLIESLPAPSHKRNVLAATSVVSSPTITILVPTTLMHRHAANIVETWGIKQPSSAKVSGSALGSHMSVQSLLNALADAFFDLKKIKDFAQISAALVPLITCFIENACSKGAGYGDGDADADAYAVWDANNISDQVLVIGQDGPISPRPEDLSSKSKFYIQMQIALAYYGKEKSFACVYSIVQRSQDELTEAISKSGTTSRINSIRVLYANLLAQSIKEKYAEDSGHDGVKLVESNVPYPDLGA